MALPIDIVAEREVPTAGVDHQDLDVPPLSSNEGMWWATNREGPMRFKLALAPSNAMHQRH